ncbi:MAG TPA: hypothetical protein VJK53_04965 [Candidatus Paceibacterota bacterium]
MHARMVAGAITVLSAVAGVMLSQHLGARGVALNLFYIMQALAGLGLAYYLQFTIPARLRAVCDIIGCGVVIVLLTNVGHLGWNYAWANVGEVEVSISAMIVVTCATLYAYVGIVTGIMMLLLRIEDQLRLNFAPFIK